MRFRIKAPIDGRIILRADHTVDADGVRYEFVAKNGTLAAIAVSAQVDAKAFSAKIGPGKGLARATITMSGDRAIVGDLIARLQGLESHLAFASAGSLTRVRWDAVEEERIAESDEERQHISVPKVSTDFPDPRPRVVLDPSAIADFVRAVASQRDLVVLKAFWREAMNEFLERRYIQAFYNFYFVIEGLYAPGKSGNRQVFKAFNSSEELREIVWRFHRIYASDRIHGPRLEAMFKAESCAMDLEGSLAFLVRMRGHLHHYSVRSPRPQPTPLNQADFHSVAWLCMGIATEAIDRRSGELPHAVPVR